MLSYTQYANKFAILYFKCENMQPLCTATKWPKNALAGSISIDCNSAETLNNVEMCQWNKAITMNHNTAVACNSVVMVFL